MANVFAIERCRFQWTWLTTSDWLNNVVSDHQNKYRVMLVIQSLRVGGAETMVENLSYALVREGCAVLVVVLQSGETILTERMRKKGVDLRILGKRPGLDLSVFRRLAAIMRDFQPDVVHSHLPILQYVVPAARKAHVGNLVHTVHSMAEKETSSNLKRLLSRCYYRNGSVVPVALSEVTKRSIEDVYGLGASQVAIVANGIDLEAYEPKRDYSLSVPTRICHIGRFEEPKNHVALVDAAVQLKADGFDVVFDLYGIGSLMEEIKGAVAKKGLEGEFSFHGLTDNVPDALGKADLFVFPSVYEGMPMVLAEAMAAGLPIVAAAVGGIPDMLEGGESALLCEADAASVASAVERLLSEEGLRKSLGMAARERAADFSSDSMARAYLDVYKRKGAHAC